MKRSTTTWKPLAIAVLATVLAMAALAGCAASGGSSAASSASGSAASTSSGAAGTNSSSGTTVTLVSPGSASSSASSSTSASSGASAASASASGASASAAVVASGTLVDYANEKAGYTFKVDKAYTIETSGNNVIVYTGEKTGQVPFFRLTIMKNSTGRSVEDLMMSTMDDTKQKYQNRLAVEPVANTVRLSDKYNRTLVGFEFAYTPENGGKTVLVANYAEEINGYFFLWSCNYYKEDYETIAAMQTAQETLQFLTA